MKSALHVSLLSGTAVIAIYLALVFGELVSTASGLSAAVRHHRNEVGVPATALTMCVLAVTVLPAAFFAGRALVLRSAGAGRAALVGVAVGFALIIGLLQIFVYDSSVLGASLLKVAFAAAGLMLVARWYPSVQH